MLQVLQTTVNTVYCHSGDPLLYGHTLHRGGYPYSATDFAIKIAALLSMQYAASANSATAGLTAKVCIIWGRKWFLTSSECRPMHEMLPKLVKKFVLSPVIAMKSHCRQIIIKRYLKHLLIKIQILI